MACIVLKGLATKCFERILGNMMKSGAKMAVNEYTTLKW
jgi:hypothetical protein